jgi:hypothetical protein
MYYTDSEEIVNRPYQFYYILSTKRFIIWIEVHDFDERQPAWIHGKQGDVKRIGGIFNEKNKYCKW